MPSKPAGTLYRGREGMWSWVAHRITGVGIFFFLLVHVLDTALVRVSPHAYNEVIGTYNPKGETANDKIQVDAAKAREWIARGATPSDTVQSLLKQAGVFKAATA